MLEYQLDDRLQEYRCKVTDRVKSLKEFKLYVNESIKDIQCRVDKLTKDIRHFDAEESAKVDIDGCQSVFLDGSDQLVACFRFEPRTEAISEHFSRAIAKWDEHIKHVV